MAIIIAVANRKDSVGKAEVKFKSLPAAQDNEAEPTRMAMLLALLMGLRREEMCGLHWTQGLRFVVQ